MNHYLLFYHVVEGYLGRRPAFREVHLQHAERARARGELVLAGALAEPVDQAVLLFRGSSPEVAESFAKNDPYVINGLVDRWEVRPWTTVVGEGISPARGPEGASVGPVARVWRGIARAGPDADAYLSHLDDDVLPALDRIDGFLKATVMRRSVQEEERRSVQEEEFIVMTFWESMDAIRRFAGDDVERAVIDPRARKVLSDTDEVVRHYRVVRG